MRNFLTIAAFALLAACVGMAGTKSLYNSRGVDTVDVLTRSGTFQAFAPDVDNLPADDVHVCIGLEMFTTDDLPHGSYGVLIRLAFESSFPAFDVFGLPSWQQPATASVREYPAHTSQPASAFWQNDDAASVSYWADVSFDNTYLQPGACFDVVPGEVVAGVYTVQIYPQ